MTRKILVMESAFNRYKDKMEQLASQHDREIVPCAPETQEEYMKYFVNNDIDIVVNTWPDSRKFGGYTPDMIRTIAKSGVRAVCHQGAGYEMAGDIEVWKNETNVQISNCPNAPAPHTADTAMFLLLGAMRNFNSFGTSLSAGKWRGSNAAGSSPQGSTLGILGMGNIGRMIRDRATPFQFDHILYHQRSRLQPDLERDSEFEPDLDVFLSKCDAIVVVAPHNKATHHLLNRHRLLNVVKPGAFIINVGRGPIIDEVALGDALEAGRVTAVGLDVYEHEPEIDPKVLKSTRSVLLPHVGTHTRHAWFSFETEIYENVKSVLETGHVISLVPELR